MIDKKMLSQINSIRNEIEELNNKIKKINNQPLKIIKDSVKVSSSEYPYIQHSCVIEGFDYKRADINKKNKNKYKKIINRKINKLEKEINRLEHELNYIDDSDIRRIIRFRYEDDLNWLQIMTRMKYNSEDTARKKLDKFLKNN